MGAAFTANQTYADDISSEDDEYIPCGNHSNYQKMQEDGAESCTYTTDAVETGAAPQEPFVNRQISDHLITVEKVGEIENDLDFYEKVSLVYLLYDEAEIALQHLLQLQQGAHINVLVEWAQFCAKTDNWQGKLVEALCIIQNYQLVCQLGYNQTEVCDRFLPLNENTSLFINLIKKKVYRICENFTEERTKQFLDIIEQDFIEKKLQFRKFNVIYLEMYFLHWLTVKYISLTDFSNLYKALKVLEMFETVDNLKSLTHNSPTNLPSQFKSVDNYKNAKVIEKLSDNNSNIDYEYLGIGATLERSLSSVSSAAGSIQQDRIRKNSYEDKSYPVDPEFPGLLLIINQENFYTEFEESLQHLLPATNKKLDNRDGTNIDRDRLEYTFKKYGFTVIIKNNKTHSEMKEDIKDAVNKVTKHSSLMICILSHGIEGKVYGVNSIPVEVREIQQIMCNTNVTNLKRKPKILILQSCQGTECQRVVDDTEDLRMDGDGPEPTPRSAGAVPRTADMLVFWATVPGYGAVRDRKRGTWFIQSFCDAILQNAAKIHFEDICTLVKQEVLDKRWETKEATRAMVPIKESTLSRFFFLPPVRL